MVRVLSDETLCRDNHCRQRSFHIRSAASEQQAVADCRLKWRIDPTINITGRHDVGVTGKRQRLTVSAPCPKILCVTKIHSLNGKTYRAQALNY
jgi:hypothetical protein